MAKKNKDYSGREKGKVIIFGDLTYSLDSQTGILAENLKTNRPIADIIEVQDVVNDRIITDKYVLPLSDANVLTSPDGLIYAYNVSLSYLSETKHLAEVEKNQIIEQAYLYSGRTTPNKTTGFQWFLMASVVLLAVIGIIK